MLFWAFTKSKSTHELAANLEEFAERYESASGELTGPKVWWVDNTHEVADFYKYGNEGGSFRGFNRDGNSLMVLADPFHMLYRVGLTLVKDHPLTSKFSGK